MTAARLRLLPAPPFGAVLALTLTLALAGCPSDEAPPAPPPAAAGEAAAPEETAGAASATGNEGAATGGEAQAATGGEAQAATGGEAQAATGDEAQAATGSEAQAATGSEAQAAPREPGTTRKFEAPVDLALTADDAGGTVTVRLDVTARQDVPKALARLVVPEGLALADGTPEVALGALAAHRTRTVRWTLTRPGRAPVEVAAGVDLWPSPGIRLHRSAVIGLGGDAGPEPELAAPEGPSAPRTLQDGGAGVRLYPMQ